jgi:hypothetical protein
MHSSELFHCMLVIRPLAYVYMWYVPLRILHPHLLGTVTAVSFAGSAVGGINLSMQPTTPGMVAPPTFRVAMSNDINDINNLFSDKLDQAIGSTGAVGGLSISPTGSSSVVINRSINSATGQAVNSQTQVTQSMNSYASVATTVTQQTAAPGAAPVQTSSSASLSMTGQGATLTARTSQGSLPATSGGSKHLLAADAADETVLSSSKVHLGDAGVAVQASSSINMVAGADDAANTAIQQTSDTLEFSVTDPTATPAAGGRKLSGAEDKRSVLRVSKDGIQMKSLDKVIMETEQLEVSGKLLATQELEVVGSFTAKQDLKVEGTLVPAGGVDLSAGEPACM